MKSKRLSIFILIALAILYIGVRVAWYDTYPPTRNYDHFNTETTLNVLKDHSLYSTDPIWQNGGQVSSLGFIFTGFMQLIEAVFDEYVAAWTFLYALSLVVYLPGAYLMFRFLTKYMWLSALLAVASSIPFYLYFSYTNWGITSPYARTFVTIQAPWLFLATMLILQTEKAKRPAWWWIGLALWVSSITYWNPVNGLALVEIFGFVLLVEWWARRITWREFAIFVGITGVLFAFYYLTAGSNFTAATTDAPLNDAELQELIDGWISFAGFHFFPWAVSRADALRVVIAIIAGSSLLLLTAPIARPKDSQAWWWLGLIIVLCQVPAPLIMTKDTSFLLIAGYWIYRYRRIDRWDVFWLSIFAAINLGSLVQEALGYYLFTEHKILSMASVAFESYRTIRWAFLILFVFAGRWVADLLSEKTNPLNLLAAAFILGSTVSRLGNIGLDDSVVVRPDEELRHALPYLGFGLAMLGHVFNLSPQPSLPKTRGSLIRSILFIPVIVLGLSIAIATAWSIPAFKQSSDATYAVLAILLLGMSMGMWEIFRQFSPQKLGSIGVFGVGMVALVIIPISTYYQKHDNHNPSADFDRAAEWVKDNTAKDALFLVVGFDAMPFRAQSERSVLTWDVLQTYYFLGPRKLLEATEFLNQYGSLNPNNPDELRTTVDRFGVDYIFASNDFGVLPYPTVFYSDDVSIYYPTKPEIRDAFYNLPNGGLSDERFAAYQDYRQNFDLVPEGEIIFMPAIGSTVRRTEALQAMAFLLETGGISDENHVFDLMILIERMRHQHELELESTQTDSLNRWNETKSPDDLAAAGIHYLLVDNRWWDLLGESQIPTLEDPSHYELLGEWQGVTSAFYRLYRVKP